MITIKIIPNLTLVYLVVRSTKSKLAPLELWLFWVSFINK